MKKTTPFVAASKVDFFIQSPEHTYHNFISLTISMTCNRTLGLRLAALRPNMDYVVKGDVDYN